jgi:protein-disulfide isomerase
LGLKSKPFADCLASGRYEPLIDQDLQLGQQLGVEATPTFFVNGVLVAGAQPYEQFAALIDRELGRTPKAANQTEP